jgi:hypothetical protein
MRTSTLEPFTILTAAPMSETHTASDEPCGCGCGCEVSLIQLARPQDTMGRLGDVTSAPSTHV